MDLGKEVSEAYNIHVDSINAFRDGFIILSDQGKLFLKKSNLSEERLLFIHAAKEHLISNNFPYIDQDVCTKDGIPFISMDNGRCVLTHVIEGTECNFDNRTEILNISRLLAHFHHATKGFSPPNHCMVRSDLGKIPVFFEKRLDEIKKLKKVAKKGKTKFDYLFLQYYDYFCNLAEEAINMIQDYQYKEVVEKTRAAGIFCHHDVTHHNIIHSDKNYYLVNFDFCCFEIKVYDIANFLRRKMRKCHWDIHEAKLILNEYRQVEEISQEEMMVLKIILQFPQKFWRVINKYYNSKRSWSEKSYVFRLQEVIDEIEEHKAFIEKFNLEFICD